MIVKTLLQLFLTVITCLGMLGLTSCYCPGSASYRALYSHLHQPRPRTDPMQESDFFLIFLVNARHLDYTNTCSFFHTVAKHPSDGSKNGDLGHAWIYLQGQINGKTYVLEGGQSGERGRLQARYFDGIMNYNDWGYANPTSEQRKHPRYEPNPAKYLWSTLHDGFFQKGSGGHRPTYAAKINLTEEQFYRILAFVHPCSYDYRHYALTQQQCSSFVAQAAFLADFFLESKTSIPIHPFIWFGKQWVRLWEDPCYAVITLATPDAIEKSLMEAVREGRAEYALDWYLQNGKSQKSACL